MSTSYSSLLDGMWGPEGSDINERLKRLQNLEKIRKEREAKRQAMLNDSAANKPISIVRTRITNKENAGPTGYGIRRTLSLNEESGYGGARPKLGSYKINTEPVTSSDIGDIFGDIKAEIIDSMRSNQRPTNRQYYGSSSTRSRYGSSESDDSNYGSSSVRSKYDFSNNYSQQPTEDGSSSSKNIDHILSKYANRKPYTSRYGNADSDEQNGHTVAEYTTEEDVNGQESNNHDVTEHHDEIFEDDEEPKHFIERLKHGNHDNNDSARHLQSGQNSAFVLSTMPTIPPYKTTEEPAPAADLPELVQPQESILSMAQEISATFGGVKSPGLSPNKTPSKTKSLTSKTKASKSPSKRKSSKKFAPEVPPKPVKSESTNTNKPTDLNSSVTYDIVTADYDSSGDEEGKLLPVRESFYNSRPSEWGVIATTPGKIDKVHEFFNGEDIGSEPCIRGVLDGETLRQELEKSFSEESDKKPEQPKTPVSSKNSSEKKSSERMNGRRSKSPLDRLKNSVTRSSESENDSVYTSGSESEAKINGKKYKKSSKVGSSVNGVQKKELSIGDKLAKLESMTQEKKRKHSVGEKDAKKPVPSYMSGTAASDKKRARNKDSSTPMSTPSTPSTPSRDLKKDVRELKQFVREHSVPSTPVDSPVKSFSDLYTTTRAIQVDTREISVQTEFVIDFPDINYVCKHCGKSSFDEVVSSPLTVENLNKNQKKVNSKKDNKSENKFSSKDSVKSLGETSTKSEKVTRYIKKTTPASHSYMKGTTSSRLKNSGPPSDGERTRKGSAPEIIHRMEQNSNVKGSQLQGTVSQKTKVFENASKTQRAKSTERKTPADDRKHLRKSKSVEQVSARMNGLSLTPDDGEDLEITLTSSETVKSEQTTPSSAESTGTRKRSSLSNPSEKQSELDHELIPDTPKSVKPHTEVGKLDLSSLETPPSPSLRKPPVASPRVKDVESSPRVDDESVVESKGQFTSIGDNPFIKKDGSSRTRTRSREKTEESVWEKAESRSRESSLKRSNSSSTAERPNSASSLKRHNTSAGEKSSVSELTWSDSGSTESLSKGSKSSHHGSVTSLNRDCDRSPIRRTRTGSSSSSTSHTSQNAMLNLLSPTSGSSRHPVSGAIETDVDAAYNDHVKDLKPNNEHNEKTVNNAHLEFAKNACNMLEFEMKKRDSSNESDKVTKTVNNNKDEVTDLETVKDNNFVSTVQDPKSNKKDKGSKKGFLKGKLFKK